MAGQRTSFTVSTFDTQGNARTSGGDTVTATLYDSGATAVGSTWVYTNGDGTYRVEYEYEVAGSYTIEVVVNSDTANKKTQALTIVAADPDPSQSTLTFPSVVTIASPAAFTAVAKDAFGNLITASALDIGFEIVGNHGLESGTVQVQNMASAAYGAT